MREERETPLPWGSSDSRWSSEVSDGERAVSAGDPRNHTVAVVGLGYVGLPTALALADAGCQVIGYDISEDRISAIKRGEIDLLDADRDRLRRHSGSDRFLLSTSSEATGQADAVIVCVPTPVDDHLVPDMTALSAACATTVANATPGQTIMLSSTTYVGCTRDMLVGPLEARGLRAGRDVFVAFSAERIDPGNPDHCQQVVPRVIGGVTAACVAHAEPIARLTASRLHAVSSPEAAEATKLLENTFRAVNIAFVNEFADSCAELGLDATEVIAAAATKPYGFLPFRPGAGVGGHCIPCDPHYLLWQMRARRVPLPVTETAMSANAMRPRRVTTRARELLGETGRSPAGSRVLIVGVTYKPGVNDLRGSPALEIIADLAGLGAHVSYADPLVDSLVVDGKELRAAEDPHRHAWDLVVLHTLHSGVDYGWLEACEVVLDATYRDTHLPAWTHL